MGRRLQAARTQTRRRADKSVNDQGEIYDDFLSETPSEVEFEEGEVNGPDAPNKTETDRVKDARRTRARRSQQRARARRANETGIKGEDGQVAKPDCREDLEVEVDNPKRTDPQVAARRNRVARKHYQGARRWAGRQGVRLTLASSPDLFDWAVQGYAHESKLNRESTRRAVSFRVAQLKKMALEDEVGLKGEGPAQSEDINFDQEGDIETTSPSVDIETDEDDNIEVSDAGNVKVDEAPGPVARRRARQSRRKQADYSTISDHELIGTYAELENAEMDGEDVSAQMAEIEAEADRRGVDLFDPNFDPNDAVEFFSNRRGRQSRRRKAGDTNLEVAAPNGRTDIESPVRNTTDDYAQDSQYEEDEYADNASDDKAKPDLSTDQNWAPGEGKRSSRQKTTGAEAARYAEAMITAGLITSDEKWSTMDQAERMSRAIVRDRTALLERTNTKWAEKVASVRPTRTSRKNRSVVPQNLGAPSQTKQSAVSSDYESDSLLFI